MSYELIPGQELRIDKAPRSVLVYGFDVRQCIPSGATLTGAALAESVGGLTVGTPGYSGTIVSVEVGAGSVGTAASVTLGWYFEGSRYDERTIHFNIVGR